MTITHAAESLGISRVTLTRYIKENPKTAPDSGSPIEAYQAFVDRLRLYPSSRGERTDLKPRTDDLISSWIDGTKNESNSPESNPDAITEDCNEYDVAALRKEQVIKLRLNNEIDREKLALVKRETLTVKEVQLTLAGIAALVKAELMELSGVMSESLSGQGATVIQEALDSAHRKVLEKLAYPESYFEPKEQELRPVK